MLPSGGQGDGHLAGDLLPHLAALVEDLSLQHGEHVVNGHILNPGIADGRHIVVRHVAGGKHAVERAVLVGHGQGGDLVRLHHLPAPADGGRGGKRRGRIIIQVPDLGAPIADELGRLEAEAVQHNLGFVADLAQPCGLILPPAQRVFQRGIGHGGNDGVCVRIAVSGDKDGIHSACFSFGIS